MSLSLDRVEDILIISSEKQFLDAISLSAVVNIFAASESGLPLLRQLGLFHLCVREAGQEVVRRLGSSDGRYSATGTGGGYHWELEMCMGKGIPMGMGIPWEWDKN